MDIPSIFQVPGRHHLKNRATGGRSSCPRANRFAIPWTGHQGHHGHPGVSTGCYGKVGILIFTSLQVTSSVIFFIFEMGENLWGNHEQYLFWWLIINFRQTDVIWCVCSIFRHTHIINILWSCTGNHPITGWFTGKIPSATHHDEWMIGLWNGNPQRNIEQPPSFSQNSIPGWNPSIRE